MSQDARLTTTGIPAAMLEGTRTMGAIDDAVKEGRAMTTLDRVRLAGIFCACGGVLWIVVLMADVVAHDSVYDTTTTFRIWEGLLILVQALLIVGVAGFAWSGATGTGQLGRIGLSIALLGRTSFLIGEISSFIQGSDDDIFVPLGALLTGTGMILAGIAVVRAGRWNSWRRYVPLTAGLYPFIAMFPILAITGTPPTFTIALWGIPWLLLGLALYAEAQSPTQVQQPTASSVYTTWS